MKLTAHPLAERLPAEASDVAPLDQSIILRLRISLARLLAKGDQLGTTFYAMLFLRHPATRQLFPHDLGQQQSKLTQMLAWIVTHLDQTDEILPAVRELGRRHAGYGAVTEHYPAVRDTLIDAMRRTAGAEWNENLSDDWRLSIDLIARHMLAGATSRVRR
jgi:hemoglobin-like flavoprotein